MFFYIRLDFYYKQVNYALFFYSIVPAYEHEDFKERNDNIKFYVLTKQQWW